MSNGLDSKVAVITRSKDRPVFLKRAMQSVLSQTFRDWIHVIVNDGGNPSTVDALVAFHADAYDGRVRVIHHGESKGMQNASNAGLDAVDAEYVVIHDDDDSWEPEFLRATTGFLDARDPESPVRGVVTQSNQVTEEILVSGQLKQLARKPYYPFMEVGLKDMLRRNLFPPIAFLYRRDVHEKIGRFRQEFDVLGDHDFNLRFLRHFEIAVLPEFHANYHWRHGSQGNTVTRSRNVHRVMLNRMQNAYHRQLLDDPATAVGDLSAIEMPPPDSAAEIPPKQRLEEPAEPRGMPNLLADYDFEVLSLDVFDTVLKRRCHLPGDLFKLLEDRAAAELGFDYPLAMARVEAEIKARRVIRREIKLKEIYDVLAQACRIPDQLKAQLLSLELQLEELLLYPDPNWIDLYAACRSKGIRVVFLSDMYLPGRIIAGLLERRGFADPEVYVSCEHGCSKHDGRLYRVVSSAVGVEPERFLHVGDNHHSDYIRALQAGWQALHWSGEFNYTPWFAQVDPFCHVESDLLSTRLFAEVLRLGKSGTGNTDEFFEKLGLEVAGPFYAAYMSWVLEQARKDRVRKLILLGRDGYYWEKACSILSEKQGCKVDIEYLHSSRKVLNFASFRSLDEEAIKFLSTPNPALAVRDFVGRTGLDPDDYLVQMQQAGFDDPGMAITTPMGGEFLEPAYAERLRNLFMLLRPGLEEQFARDRAGVETMFQQAGFDPADCAVVDIGWNASCVQALARLFRLKEPVTLKGYFFGTWEKAHQGRYPSRVRSFFVDGGKPPENTQLVRESVNLLEALNAAPYPTLVAFKEVEGAPVPQFSEHLRGGFSAEQQTSLWRGAERLLRALAEYLPDHAGNRPGHNYLHLVLRRLLVEPSRKEVETLGDTLHSEGFGIVSHTPLVRQIRDDTYGDDLMRAYWSSNWKRGFLTVLPEEKFRFVIEHAQPGRERTLDQLKDDLKWRQKQVDAFWNEKEEHKKEIELLREQISQLKQALGQLKTDLDWKSGEAHALFNEKERLRKELEELKQSIRQPGES